MKKIFAILTLTFAAVACWKAEVDDIERGADLKGRHQVTDLKAVAGDTEVQLSWGIPEGWTPTDYLIKYTDPDQQVIELHSAETSLLVTDLVNGFSYTFSVQALYGDLVSGAVTAKAKPETTRIAVSDLAATEGDASVELTWTKPDAGVLSYKLSYYMEDAADAVKTVTLDKDAVTYTVEGLMNDVNWYFTLVATYVRGDSEPATVKAMPTKARAFILSSDKAAVLQPIRFRLNTTDYPDAENVWWEFPGGMDKEGKDIEFAFPAAGEHPVVLHATIDGMAKSWKFTVTIREYVVWDKDFPLGGTAAYNGFKATCPVFSPDGKTAYVITFNATTVLMAYDLASGEKKWSFAADPVQASYNMLTVNPVTGDIYFGTASAGTFYSVSAEGIANWKYEGLGSMKAAAPAVSKDGATVYCADAAGKVAALKASDGTLLWENQAGGTKGSSGILVNGDELLVGWNSTSPCTLTFINAKDGSEIKYLTGAKGMTEITGFTVSADKRYAYFGNKGGGISKVDLTKHEYVIDNQVIGTADIYEPVISPAGDIFVGCKNSYVYCVDGDKLEKKWEYAYLSGTNNAFNYSHPCSDTEGNFYISAGQVVNQNFIFGPDGSVKSQWSYETEDKSMGGNNFLDGVLYSAFVGTADTDGGVFVGKYVGGIRYTAHGIDICGSCAIN